MPCTLAQPHKERSEILTHYSTLIETWINKNLCKFTHVYAHPHKLTHTHERIYTSKTFTHAHTYTRTLTHTRAHTHIHTQHTHAHTHMRTSSTTMCDIEDSRGSAARRRSRIPVVQNVRRVFRFTAASRRTW